MAMKCGKCGQLINPEKASDPCPNCGEVVMREVLVEDSGHGHDMPGGLKAKDESGIRLFERKWRDKLSRQGHKAREFLEFDHRDSEKTTKTHIVEEQTDDGSWKVVHNEHPEFPAKRRNI